MVFHAILVSVFKHLVLWEFGLSTSSLSCFRSKYGLCFVLSIGLAIGASSTGPQARAQQEPEFAVEGYITAVQSPTSFEVYGTQVETSPETTWRITGKGAAMNYGQPLRSLVQVGVYVRVAGQTNRHTHIVAGEEISLRNDWDRKLSGIGVIDKLLEGGPQPKFRADGYRIRITSSTDVAFSGDLKTLNDLTPNTWLHFEGKLDKSGALIATKVNFLPSRPARFKSVLGSEVNKITVAGEPTSAVPSGSGPADEITGDSEGPTVDSSAQPETKTQPNEKHRYSEHKSHFKEVEDPALQARVQRIGLSVVPEYQKKLPDDHPAKIQFRFIAVDNAKYRSEICSVDGLIVVPWRVVERLKSDDQLAAVLADGVAFDLQRQAARIVSVNRVLLGADIAGDIAGAFVPGLSLVTLATMGSEHKINVLMEEERGRIALALMRDAGYDLRQAPEAWRLLAPKHLPANLGALKYPDRSGYQLSVLRLQYGQSADAPASANLSPASR
jgi:hypothetical protein